jgi:hypothetical protein
MARILSALVVGMLLASSAQAQVVVYPSRVGTMPRMYSTPTVVVAPRVAAPAVVVAPRVIAPRVAPVVAYAPRRIYNPTIGVYGAYRPVARTYGVGAYGVRPVGVRTYGVRAYGARGAYVAPRASGRAGYRATTVRAGRVGVGATSYRSVGRVGARTTAVRAGAVRARR